MAIIVGMSTRNGHPKPIEETQSELRRVRAETKLTEARIRHRHADLQRQLLESAYVGYPSFTGGWGEMVDPMDRWRDGDRLLTPLTWDGGLGRGDPYVSSEAELAELRQLAEMIGRGNPYAIGALENLTSFVLGDNGMTLLAMSREDAAEGLVEEAQDVIDSFWDANEFGELQAELLHRAVVHGECFPRYFPEQDQVMVRVVEPEQVSRPLGSPDEWSWGIRHAQGDVQTPVAYAVWYGSSDDWCEVPASDMDHWKRNVYRNVKRGISDFFATSSAFEGARKLVRNLGEGGALQAAIAWIEEYDSASQSSVRGQLDTNQDYSRTGVTGKTVRHQKYEPGTRLLIPKGRKYQSPPLAGNTAHHVSIVQALLRLLGSRWAMPEYMISGDSSNANFASTLVSGAPFSRFIRRLQGWFKVRFVRMAWRAIKQAHHAGRFRGRSWEELLFLLDVQAEAPTPDIANETETATVDHMDIAGGVMSIQTRRQRRGLDPEKEKANLKSEPITRIVGMVTPVDPETGEAAMMGGEAAPVIDPKTTVGGLQAVAALQASYYGGAIPRTAAVNFAVVVFKFTQPEAEQLFPEEKPVRLTPTDADATANAATVVTADPEPADAGATQEALVRSLRQMLTEARAREITARAKRLLG